MRIKQNQIFTGGLVSTTVLSALFLSFPSVFADTGFVDVITIDVPVSCSLSATGANSHVDTVQNGSTGNDIGTTNIKVTCNDNTGYALYAIGYTNDEYGYNKLHSAALGTSNDIITSATVTTGTSSWAMKLAATSGTYAPTIVTDFASYAAVPTEYTKVAYYPSSTDLGTSAIGSNLTTTYRAYISPTQPAGIYVGQVKYTLVHPNGDFPIPDNSLVGAVLRFNEDVDVESLVQIMGGNYTYNDLHFAIKVSPTDFLNYLGVQDSSITTWSQFVDVLPELLTYLGATDVQSDMQILDEDQSYSYLNYLGFYPFHEDGTYTLEGQDRNYLYFHRSTYGADTSAWSYLPASTGSLSYTLGDESFSFNSFEELIGMVNGAWLDENYYEDDWSEEFFRTIYIYGGTDATDPSLIQWLEDNAKVLYIRDSLAGTEWILNEDVPSYPGLRWNVSGSVYNNQYSAYYYDYIGAASLYGIPFWSFWYQDVTSPYTSGDAFIYIPEDASIPAYNIDYSAGWYFGNRNNPTQLVQMSPPTLTLVNGEDLYNPSFADWLHSNATRK